MYCGECDKNITTVDIVNQSLQRLRDAIIPGNIAQLNRPDTNIPLSSERLDMAAYIFLYHMNGGCALETDPFWGNVHVQETVLKYRFKEHSSSQCILLQERLQVWIPVSFHVYNLYIHS